MEQRALRSTGSSEGGQGQAARTYIVVETTCFCHAFFIYTASIVLVAAISANSVHIDAVTKVRSHHAQISPHLLS